MQLEHYNPELKIADDAFAWRYMPFEKIWDMLLNNKIYFSRLDSFDDPIEGMPVEYIQALYYANINKFNESYETEKLPLQFDVEKWQHGVFSLCWFLTEGAVGKISSHEESFAMWQLYSNNYGFTIKINFSELRRIIENAIIDLIDDEIIKAFFCKVEYLGFFDNFFPQNNSKANKEILCSSIKHLSYKHENELRFLFLAKNFGFNRKGFELKLKDAFTNVNPAIEIFSHPNMDDEVFFTFRDKFKTLGFTLQHSRLLTTKVIKRYLK